MIIDIQRVSKVYGSEPNEVSALQDVSLGVEAGEFLAIMGPSGSGKTTLMNLLGLLDRPNSGRFSLDGEDLKSKNDNDLARLRREKIGFIFQSFNLFPRATALKNVAMPLVYAGVPSKERNGRASALLKKVGLSERGHHLPHELSGGQQQRVAIARALINHPLVILADEPTGNLDSTTGESILRLLRELNEGGVTILMVTHDDRVAGHAGRTVRLFDGRIVEDTKKARARGEEVRT